MIYPTKKTSDIRHILHILALACVVLWLVILSTACNEAVRIAPTGTSANSPTSPLLLSPTKTPVFTPTTALDGRGGGVISYASWEKSEWQIYLMNADGSGKQRLTFSGRGGYEPNWSPEGGRIVFQYSGIWIAETSTGEAMRIPINADNNDLPNTYLVKPSWSPDGEWIAFLNENGYQGDLYLVHPDGTSLTRLTDINSISRDANLVWSPDGSQIAFSVDLGGRVEIFLLDIQEALLGRRSSHQVTNSSGFVRNLVTSWSPDGSQLAFSSDQDGNTEIYIVNLESDNQTRLTNNLYSDSEPAWSPDGKQIAFSSNRDGNVEIYVMDTEKAIHGEGDADVRRLTNHPGEDVGPVWMPLPQE